MIARYSSRAFFRRAISACNFSKFRILRKNHFNISLLFFGAPLMTNKRRIANDVVHIGTDVAPVDL